MEEKTIRIYFDDETGLWRGLPEPFAVIEVPTEENYEYLKKALKFYAKYKDKITEE